MCYIKMVFLVWMALLLTHCTLDEMSNLDTGAGTESLSHESSSQMSVDTTEATTGGDDLVTYQVNVTCNPSCTPGTAVWFYWYEEKQDEGFVCEIISGDDSILNDKVQYEIVHEDGSVAISFLFEPSPVTLFLLVFNDLNGDAEFDWQTPEPFALTFVDRNRDRGDTYDVDVTLRPLLCEPESGGTSEESSMESDKSDGTEEETGGETGMSSFEETDETGVASGEIVITMTIPANDLNARLISEFGENGWEPGEPAVTGPGMKEIYRGTLSLSSCVSAVSATHCEFNMWLKNGQIPFTQWSDDGDGEVEDGECSLYRDDLLLEVKVDGNTRQQSFGKNKKTMADQCNVWFVWP